MDLLSDGMLISPAEGDYFPKKNACPRRSRRDEKLA
jgi:hypothetical protein